jgi:hypothetical protein
MEFQQASAGFTTRVVKPPPGMVDAVTLLTGRQPFQPPPEATT